MGDRHVKMFVPVDRIEWCSSHSEVVRKERGPAAGPQSYAYLSRGWLEDLDVGMREKQGSHQIESQEDSGHVCRGLQSMFQRKKILHL